MLPALFISHGAPNLVLNDTPARDALIALGRHLPRPDAILCISAHYETDQISVSSDHQPETLYDFGGFEPELYEMTYPAPGAPGLAEEILVSLKAEGVQVRFDKNRGFDHGVWVPLSLMFPEADIPVVQMSVRRDGHAAEHFALGRLLKPLRERKILIIGSGAMTHNLSEAFRWVRTGQGPAATPDAPDWVNDFAEKMIDAAQSGTLETIADNPDKIPGYRDNHPTDEHILPLFVAAGAADGEGEAELIHRSIQYHVLRMDALAFGGQKLQSSLMSS